MTIGSLSPQSVIFNKSVLHVLPLRPGNNGGANDEDKCGGKKSDGLDRRVEFASETGLKLLLQKIKTNTVI